MSKTTFFLLLLSGLLYADSNISTAPLQEKIEKQTLTFSGQYRGRFDTYKGVNKVAYGDNAVDSKGNVRGVSDDAIYLQQIIAGFTYLPSFDWEIKAYLYDSRSWGSSLDATDFTKNSGTPDQYSMSYYDDHLELFETYVRKYNFLTKGLALTLGRQQLGYGDRRVFGPGKWGNTMGWLWDAAHLSYKKDKNFIDLWYGQTRIKEPNDFSIKEKHRYQGVGVYAHYEATTVKVEPFLAWRNTLYHDTITNEDAYYYGMRIYDKSPGFVFDATYIKAFGNAGTLDIDSYAYAAKVGYQFDTTYQPKLLIGAVYATGDKDPNDSKKQTFSTPFGANDGLHYGRMDVMFWTNMQDYQASFSLKPTKKLSVETAYHHFKLAEATDKWYFFGYSNSTGNRYKNIGDEYDLILKYKLTKKLDFLAIGSYLNAGDFIKKNNISQNDATKVFLQFQYKFSQ